MDLQYFILLGFMHRLVERTQIEHTTGQCSSVDVIQSWMTTEKTEISAQHEFIKPVYLSFDGDDGSFFGLFRKIKSLFLFSAGWNANSAVFVLFFVQREALTFVSFPAFTFWFRDHIIVWCSIANIVSCSRIYRLGPT